MPALRTTKPKYDVVVRTTGGVSGFRMSNSTTPKHTKEEAKKYASSVKKDLKGVKERLKKRGIRFGYIIIIKKKK